MQRGLKGGGVLFLLPAIVFVILLFVYPITGLMALAQVIGIFSIASGIILGILAAKLALSPHKAPAAV